VRAVEHVDCGGPRSVEASRRPAQGRTAIRRFEMKIRMLAGLLLAGALVGCQTVQTTQPGAVGVERQQRMLVSSAEVDKAAEDAYRKTMQEAANKGALNRDAAQVNRVRAIANRLIPATAAFRADATRWRWEVNVISSPELNAWCMPGGKIAVYSGIIDKLQLTDAELAAIMGHEIAHALREHGRERISQQAAQQAVIGVGAAILGVGGLGRDLAGMVADVTVGLPNSREHEREADRIGVELAARAGYDPRAAVTLWQKMQRVNSGGPPQFLSTHPSGESRIQDLQAQSNTVMPLYEAARRR